MRVLRHFVLFQDTFSRYLAGSYSSDPGLVLFLRVFIYREPHAERSGLVISNMVQSLHNITFLVGEIA